MGLPQRDGAHPSAYAGSFLGPGALGWLPALWVSADRPGSSRFGGYVDQSHLNWDVMAFAGVAPTAVALAPWLAVDDIAWPALGHGFSRTATKIAW